MAFVPAVSVVGVQLEGRVDNCQTINDLYFKFTAGLSLPDVQGLVANLANWFTLSFASNLSEDWSTLAIHGRGLDVQNGIVVDSTPTPMPGGETGEAAPNNVALCISFRTGIGGRAFRGRNYVPGVPNSMITLNTFDADWLAAVAASYALLLPGGGALPTGWTWGVLSRFSGVDGAGHPIPRAEGVFTPITNTVYSDITADSMRGRLPGRGK